MEHVFYTKIEVVTPELVDAMYINQGLGNTGIYQESREKYYHKANYASKESRSGEMDFINSEKYTNLSKDVFDRKEDVNEDFNSPKLYVTISDKYKLAHNPTNFGNFLWGGATQVLGLGMELFILVPIMMGFVTIKN